MKLAVLIAVGFLSVAGLVVLLLTLAPRYPLSVGTAMVAASVGLIWVFVCRWDWLRRIGLDGGLTWGSLFPPSKLGATMGAIVFGAFGLRIADARIGFCSDAVWSITLTALVALSVPIGIYDYILYKRRP